MSSGHEFSGVMRVLVSVVAAIAAVAVSGLLTLALGVSPVSAALTSWDGALGSGPALAASIVAALPIAMAALAFVVAFRSGVINIGMEGQLYLGAMAAVEVGGHLGSLGAGAIPIALAAGCGAGALWAGVAWALKAWRGVNEILSTLFLTYVAVNLTNWLISGPLRAAGSSAPQSIVVGQGARLPNIVPGSTISLGGVLVVLAAVFVYVLLRRTTLGFEMRVVGLSSAAARYAGMPVERAQAIGFLASGGIAGLGGAIEVLGNQYVVLPGFSPGWGFIGILAALLGGLTAVGALAAGFFVGVLTASGKELQFEYGVPAQLATVVQAVAVILVLVGPMIAVRVRARLTRRRTRVRSDGARMATEGTT